MSRLFAKSSAAIFGGLILFCGFQMMCGPRSAVAAEPSTPAGPAVTVTEDATSFTLSNGTVVAHVAKRTGVLTSLTYKGTETLYTASGSVGAYWSHDATGGTSTVTRITIDPKSNNGDRAEVSVKGIARTDISADVELRFSMGRGESGIYTYSIFDHLPQYPAASMNESRWVAKLADYFDWTQVDDERIMREVPKEVIGHLYKFAASPFENRAYGWASSKKGIGIWLINASTEYIGGGATKTDFLAHRDTNEIAAPCILNFWKGSHFGNGTVPLGQGEHWTKVIGPMFIYCNSGADPLAMLKDAKAQAQDEIAKWPYEWVNGVEYAQRGDRTTVKGQIVLVDPLMPSAKLSNLLVGLAHPAYAPPTGGRGGRGRAAAAAPDAVAAPGGRAANVPPEAANTGRGIDWQSDAKYYQYWAHGQDSGDFAIPNVRAGTYTLHAISDGVLGEFAQADITVESGKPIDLGKLTWTPVRRGKQVWEIGIPNRNAKEFTYGDKYFDPNSELLYPKLFPNDVNFVIGTSDTRKDWFYEQLPHATDDSGRLNGNAGVTGSGRATPYKIRFEMPTAPKGKATLRVAICGTGARAVVVTVNDKPAGQVNLMGADTVITRQGSQGIWYEREVAFDASLMTQGANVMTLTVPAGPVNNGVLYDYLRLELDESAQGAAVP
jgi:rhamnogalacturonan endolyase